MDFNCERKRQQRLHLVSEVPLRLPKFIPWFFPSGTVYDPKFIFPSSIRLFLLSSLFTPTLSSLCNPTLILLFATRLCLSLGT